MMDKDTCICIVKIWSRTILGLPGMHGMPSRKNEYLYKVKITSFCHHFNPNIDATYVK